MGDIEDLLNLGSTHTTCPFFSAQVMAVDAQLIFCPYNYLLDPSIASALKIDVANAVVILDEGHNIEGETSLKLCCQP